jgi:hypothetical protein
MRRTAVLLAATLAILLAAAAPGLLAGQAAALIDFNDDNFEDLAVGAPGEGSARRGGQGR